MSLTEQVQTYLTPTDKRKLVAVARDKGLPPSTLVRLWIIHKTRDHLRAKRTK